jgi:hypothetical protein
VSDLAEPRVIDLGVVRALDAVTDVAGMRERAEHYWSEYERCRLGWMAECSARANAELGRVHAQERVAELEAQLAAVPRPVDVPPGAVVGLG